MAGLLPEWQEIIERAIRSQLEDVWTGLVATVEAYDPVTQKADLANVTTRPIKRLDGSYTQEKLPVLPDVPIAWPRAGQFSITWPLIKGDAVVGLVLTRSIAPWLAQGSTGAPPGDLATHHLANAVAWPALAPDSQALPASRAGDSALRLDGPTVKVADEPNTTVQVGDSTAAGSTARVDAATVNIADKPATALQLGDSTAAPASTTAISGKAITAGDTPSSDIKVGYHDNNANESTTNIRGNPVLLGDDTATSMVALADLVNTELAKVATAFSSFVPGSGGASFGSPYTSAGDVSATKVKAK